MVENKYWYRGKFKKIVLTEYGRNYLIKHFPNTKNDFLMEKMGLNFSSFHRIARSLGLLKTKKFMRKMQAGATEAALQSWKALPPADKKPYGARFMMFMKIIFMSAMSLLKMCDISHIYLK